MPFPLGARRRRLPTVSKTLRRVPSPLEVRRLMPIVPEARRRVPMGFVFRPVVPVAWMRGFAVPTCVTSGVAVWAKIVPTCTARIHFAPMRSLRLQPKVAPRMGSAGAPAVRASTCAGHGLGPTEQGANKHSSSDACYYLLEHELFVSKLPRFIGLSL